jgi:hypothetical protein
VSLLCRYCDLLDGFCSTVFLYKKVLLRCKQWLWCLVCQCRPVYIAFQITNPKNTHFLHLRPSSSVRLIYYYYRRVPTRVQVPEYCTLGSKTLRVPVPVLLLYYNWGTVRGTWRGVLSVRTIT